MGHARVAHRCDICGRWVYGNGGQVSHGRAHVNRGEAVELVKHYATTSIRLFLNPGDEAVIRYVAKGFEIRPKTN